MSLNGIVPSLLEARWDITRKVQGATLKRLFNPLLHDPSLNSIDQCAIESLDYQFVAGFDPGSVLVRSLPTKDEQLPHNIIQS